MALDVVHERCCGLDVHKRTVVACVIVPDGREVRTFGTMTDDLEALAGWLAERRVHACRDGEHRRVLEAGLQRAGDVRADAGGERAAHQGGAGPQDRRARRGVDRGVAAPRAVAGQLCARPRRAGAAGTGAVSQGADPRAGDGEQSDPEGAGRGEHQARLGGLGRAGEVGPGDAGSAQRRRDGPGGPGGAGPRQAATQAGRVGAGLARRGGRAPAAVCWPPNCATWRTWRRRSSA